MRISTVLDQIENGQMALPEFQRGYVWNRDQVRGLVRSLYKRYPVGSLLAWNTDSSQANARGVDLGNAGQQVKMLLDGQQRMTSLYGIIKGKPPAFFDGNRNAFIGLYFNVETEEFSFFMPGKMQGNPLWIDVTRLMQEGPDPFLQAILTDNPDVSLISRYSTRLNRLRDIREIDVHIEDVSGEEMTLDVVVDIFNRVNSGGRTLSKGDLALAKICSVEPEARVRMRQALDDWNKVGFSFKLDWLLRNVTTIATGDARFSALHDLEAATFDDALKRAIDKVNYLLDLLGARLGLDHNQVLTGHYGFPVLTRFLDDIGHHVNKPEVQDKVLFWYVQAAIWGRYSGSTESVMARDLNILLNAKPRDGMDALIRELKLWRGNLRIRPEHFTGWSRGNRFYFILYMLTRVGEAKDWGLGIPLRKGMLGKNTSLEVHHIFPKDYLKQNGYDDRKAINALANFCFLTKNTNLQISNRAPEDYFQEVAENQPGALESQWIPMDPVLWKAENYMDFLAERQRLLAEAANDFLGSLYPLGEDEERGRYDVLEIGNSVPGGIADEDEEAEVDALNDWMTKKELPPGEKEYELCDPETDELLAVLDLAWPEGLQEGLSEPVALALSEGEAVLKAAVGQGYQVFDNPEDLRVYAARAALGDSYYGLPEWAQLVDEAALPVVHHIVRSDLPTPECGVSLQSKNEEVVGEFELAWPEKKVAIWPERPIEPAAKEVAADWMTFSIAEVIESPGLLNVALGRLVRGRRDGGAIHG